MARQDGPMPLGDLPEYMRSVREGRNGDYVPVVDVGRIVDDTPRSRGRGLAYASAACVLLAVGVATYAVTSTESIVVDAGDIGPKAVADMISDQGGRVFSVNQNEDDTYEVRVLAFGRMSNFIERLRDNKEFKKVEVK